MSTATHLPRCTGCGNPRLVTDHFCASCGAPLGPASRGDRLAAAGIDVTGIWLSEIGVSQRAASLFAQAGYYVLADAVHHSDVALRAIRGFGPAFLQEFTAAVESLEEQADEIRAACAARI